MFYLGVSGTSVFPAIKVEVAVLFWWRALVICAYWKCPMRNVRVQTDLVPPSTCLEKGPLGHTDSEQVYQSRMLAPTEPKPLWMLCAVVEWGIPAV